MSEIKTAINMQQMSGDIGRIVTQQKDDRGGNLLRLAKTAKRHDLCSIAPPLGVVVPLKTGTATNKSWHDAVDGNAVR